MEYFTALMVSFGIILAISIIMYIHSSVHTGLSDYFAKNYKAEPKKREKSCAKCASSGSAAAAPLASFSSASNSGGDQSSAPRRRQSGISQRQRVASPTPVVATPPVASPAPVSSTGGASCKIHDTERLSDWLGGKTEAPLTCQSVNWTAVDNRNRFNKKGADMNDGYGGAKYACERTREVSSDGTQQRGCIWNLDESGVDSGDGRGMRDWIESRYGNENKDEIHKNGPCQPSDFCENQKVRGDDVVKDLKA
uniref:Uncharacterized protein n=1 Tax=viral metagenome TaxID=1070528 RepID=A0A6C0AV25_9ZZZZ